MFRTVRVNKHQKALWFQNGDFKRLLEPGRRFVWTGPLGLLRCRIERVNVLETRFQHPLLDVLVQDADVKAALRIVNLTDTERALVWKDGRLAYILGPGRHAFWREPYELAVEVFNVEQLRFAHPRSDVVVAHPEANKWLKGVLINEHEEVLLMVDGKVVETLKAGRHLFWQGAGRIEFKAIDKREQLADVAGQEIMTADKVTLRVNLLVSYVVADAIQAVTAVSDYAQALYREAQLVLRAAVGTRTLDALLGDKESVGGEVRETLAKRASQFGMEVRSVGLKDIVLPGDMKAILNQVITAEKEAQANLIKRREETAAARSQANTARLLAENPALARMKELEILQEILAGTKATFVFGAGNVAEQIRGLIARDTDNPNVSN